MIAPAPEIEPPPRRRARPVAWGLGVFVVACAAFGYRLGAEPHFADESAYVAQSFYADLLLDGRRDDPAWLDYAGIDLPPGAKYLVGLALRAGGFSRHGPTAASAWYEDTSRRFETPGSLAVARLPMVPLGALGCVAAYAIARRAFGPSTALVAAGLLIASPLYYLHARRAMSDIPAEASGLIALALGLAAWSLWLGPGDAIGRGRLVVRALGAFALALLAGAFVGLATLCKLNGSLAGMVLAAWAGLGLASRRAPGYAKLGLVASTVAAGAVAVATFAALDPTLTARPSGPLPPGIARLAPMSPLERARVVKDHRVAVSAIGQRGFPDDALPTLGPKALAVLVQGFGRFSPIGPRHSDSTRRFDPRQDWPVVAWLPLVVAGAVVAYRRGRDQSARGEPTTAWAVLLGWVVALVVVTSFIPLAWDRYYLPIQPGAAILGAAALTSLAARLRRPREATP
jgi:4-amino-4-deoxy-L-arabinose transferase-like glycosyltransferase